MHGVALGHVRTVTLPSCAVRVNRMQKRKQLVVRASDDEDMVPIISGHRKQGFTPKELDQLRHPRLLGGKTVGEELAIIRNKYQEAEAAAEAHVSERLSSSQWDGDVYIGSRWNTLSVIYLIFLLSTAGVGLFAYLSYGHLWGITPGLY